MNSVRAALRKTSLIDYPGLVSAVIFFEGCNLRCPWCHNRDLVLGTDPALTGLEDALALIEQRKNLLGGVVLSGGEPTLFAGIGALIRRITSWGLKVKLDTNGTRPGVLESLLGADETTPDYIAMDLKTSPERYRELLPEAARGQTNPGEALKQSAALVRASSVPHEFRSLALGGSWFGEDDRAALAPLAGTSLWRVRPFIPGNCLDPAWNGRNTVSG